MTRRGALAALIAVAVLVPPSAALAARDLGPYRGLGSWVDIFDHRDLRDPVGTVKAMRARGVRTVYLETSNFSQPRAIVHRRATVRFLHAAHARGMKVVAWYLPGLQKLRRDRLRSLAAIRFRTAKGHRFDSFALDIESSLVDPPDRRCRRLLRLSRQLRKRALPGYTLGAIIPAPRGIQLAKGYWPRFPYRRLARIYDVFVPMGYYTYRYEGREAAREYTRRNVQILRRRTGDPTIPIHMIGGLSGESSRGEVRGFVRAVREYGLLGGSLYDFRGTRRRHWEELAAVPVNPRQDVPLPAPLSHSGPLGNVPGVDVQHPKEVTFKVGKRAGSWNLTYEAYDAGPGEVEILVNWKRLGEVVPTPPDAWGPSATVPIPDRLLREDARNLIHFVATGDHPSWSTWGVRGVSLSAAPGP
ncbi:MAG TPA: hypothetical protein VF058_11480 [Actinomycetota bacterium]